MVGITHKQRSLRKAIAEATVKLSKKETIEAIEKKQVAKGDIFEFSRAAGLLAVKKTSEMIPDCHPLPIEYTAIRHRIDGLNIHIEVEVHAIYRTGVEVEAMHGAAITALTIYDMLKPLDKGIEISDIRLVEKKGGKSDLRKQLDIGGLKAAVIVCSDRISQGSKEDLSGRLIREKLESYSLPVSLYEIIPDELDLIRAKAIQLADSHFDLVIFTGGTGLSPRDVTPDAISPLLDRPVPGIMEAARSYGQERTPYAMLSRGVAGFHQNCLLLTLPGSAKGAEESMDAIFPQLLHVFHIARGGDHGQTK